MEPRLQRRIQRYGWDLAAAEYEPLWRAQLAIAHSRLLECAQLAPGMRVLDVACGTGLATFGAARAVGPKGSVVGIDISDEMVQIARARAADQGLENVRFARMDAENLDVPGADFDVVLCALGLMFMPDPERAIREMRRVVRPGGRIVIAVWGNRAACGWSTLFSIVDAEVVSDVCPLFFRLGQGDMLARTCAGLELEPLEQHRIPTILEYADADDACDAAFVGGPVALAWARFDEAVRARVRARYIESIAGWRMGDGYRIPGEFVVVAASAPEFRYTEGPLSAENSNAPLSVS